jgi:hypothetical protein
VDSWLWVLFNCIVPVGRLSLWREIEKASPVQGLELVVRGMDLIATIVVEMRDEIVGDPFLGSLVKTS